MEEKTKVKEAFEAARQEKVSGVLKFDQDYISTFEMFEAVVKWLENDERVERAIIRSTTAGRHGVDFLFNYKGLTPKERTTLLHTRLIPYFKEYFEEDYLHSWDYSDDAIVVK